MSGDAPSEAQERFRASAFERLVRIEAAWVALTRGQGTAKIEEDIFREILALKGDARVMGMVDVALICQRLEDLLFAARRRRFRVHEDVDAVATMAIQFAWMLLRKKPGPARQGVNLEGFLTQIEQVLSEWLQQSSEAPEFALGPSSRVWLAESTGRLGPSLRARLGLAATTVYLERLRAQGKSRDRLGHAYDMLSRDIAHLEAAPLAPVLEKHAAAARELARELQKLVVVTVDAGDVCVGVETENAIGAAVLHGVRNAVDHGVELAEDRKKRGKSTAGAVRLHATTGDDVVEVVVADDGGGVDLERVRARAVERGLRTEAEAASATHAELLEVLFVPGFSTRKQVGDGFGGGIGLEAARGAAEALGGSVRLESTPGLGTTLKVSIPQRRVRVFVHAFRHPSSSHLFAVEDSWLIDAAAATGDAIDPVKALDLPRESPSLPPSSRGRGLRLRRGDFTCALVAEGTPQHMLALRRCPTPHESPVEIVEIEGREAILLRPDVLVRSPLPGIV
jgi:two-component system, chemotaxis family, sensor kinase CheA